MKKIPIGVSRRLFEHLSATEAALYRAGIFTETVKKYFEFIPFSDEDEKRLTEREFSVHANSGIERMATICGYIFKREVDEQIKKRNGHDGLGIEALKIMHRFPLVPVEEDLRLEDACLRDNFFKRIYVTHRWQELLRQGLTARGLIDFHARHKLIIMCHADYRDLGQLLAGLTKENLAKVADQYILQLMNTLLTLPTRANHANVLHHIQGYLKKELDRDDKAELCELIESYRNFEAPLIAPITLLRHHFRKSPDPYIQSSYYFSPYPSELGAVSP